MICTNNFGNLRLQSEVYTVQTRPMNNTNKQTNIWNYLRSAFVEDDLDVFYFAKLLLNRKE